MAGRFRREGSDALIVFPTSLAAYPLTAASASAPATSWIQVALVSPVEPRGLDITAEDIRQMAENFGAGKYPEPPTRICIDYEHLSLKPSKPGDGKVAGWIVALEVRNGDAELWTQVEWTPAGAEAVRPREYQFISPVIASGFVTNAGEPTGTTLLNAALTDNPQLQGRADQRRGCVLRAIRGLRGRTSSTSRFDAAQHPVPGLCMASCDSICSFFMVSSNEDAKVAIIRWTTGHAEQSDTRNAAPDADRSEERAGRPRATVMDLRSITGSAAGSRLAWLGTWSRASGSGQDRVRCANHRGPQVASDGVVPTPTITGAVEERLATVL